MIACEWIDIASGSRCRIAQHFWRQLLRRDPQKRCAIRHILLVATPLEENLDWALHKLGAGIKSTAEPIDWNLTTIDSLPEIRRHRCFARHMVVAVLDKDVWTNPALTLLEKFRRASYWEHQGSYSSPTKKAKSGKPGDCREWNEEAIRSIDTIQFLGEIGQSDEVISIESESSLNYHSGRWDKSLYPPMDQATSDNYSTTLTQKHISKIE